MDGDNSTTAAARPSLIANCQLPTATATATAASSQPLLLRAPGERQPALRRRIYIVPIAIEQADQSNKATISQFSALTCSASPNWISFLQLLGDIHPEWTSTVVFVVVAQSELALHLIGVDTYEVRFQPNVYHPAQLIKS